MAPHHSGASPPGAAWGRDTGTAAPTSPASPPCLCPPAPPRRGLRPRVTQGPPHLPACMRGVGLWPYGGRICSPRPRASPRQRVLLGRKPGMHLSVGSSETEQRHLGRELPGQGFHASACANPPLRPGTAGTEPGGLGRVGVSPPPAMEAPGPASPGRLCRGAGVLVPPGSPAAALQTDAPSAPSRSPTAPPLDQTPCGTGGWHWGPLMEMVWARLRAGRKTTVRRQENCE